MISLHFDMLREANKLLRDGEDIAESSSVSMRRLLEAAQSVEGSDCSAIIRFFAQQNLFMADPAIEGRINNVGPV